MKKMIIRTVTRSVMIVYNFLLHFSKKCYII